MIVLPFLKSNARAQRSGFSAFAVMVWVGLVALGAPAVSEAQGTTYATAQTTSVTPHLNAYGQVVPISMLPVTAAESGVIAGLRVLPGMSVRAGQVLAQLVGPEIQAALVESQANLRSARSQLVASQKSLAILERQLTAHLSTRQAIHLAQGEVAQAQTNFDNARTHLQAVRSLMTITSPASGIVVAVNAPDGELVGPGQVVATLQVQGRLWLKATYYGSETSAIRRGMKGIFTPSNGEGPIPVQVREIFGTMTPGGGESVALIPRTSSVQWMNGEYGVVRLDLPSQMLVAVPTRALILNRGKWWIVVHSAQGDRPQAVVPGPSRGWQTYLVRGVAPGTQVVVENAYFLFNRGIARSYQPPD